MEHPGDSEVQRPVWPLAVALLIALAVFGLGVFLAATAKSWSMLAAGATAVVGVIAVWGGVAAVYAVDRAAAERTRRIRGELDRVNALLTLISEQQLISDRAKAVAFREKDADALRRAIQEDIDKQDFEAALGLVESMENEFGYRSEAERFRREVIERRDESQSREMNVGALEIQKFIEAEQWQAAMKEVDRLRTRYPDHPRVAELSGEIESRRGAVKASLLQRWRDTVKERRIDDAIAVLRKLDAYLTPIEAASLEDDARMIFKEKINTLRDSVTQAVQQHRWRDAIQIGETILHDFPNTQMAREMREMMPMLKERLEESRKATPA